MNTFPREMTYTEIFVSLVTVLVIGETTPAESFCCEYPFMKEHCQKRRVNTILSSHNFLSTRDANSLISKQLRS